MIANQAYAEKEQSLVTSKVKDLMLFIKFRLSVLVLFSAAAGYVLTGSAFVLSEFLLLMGGGFLVTGAANGLNQIFERRLDALMSRTANRPLPSGRMSLSEAWTIALVSGVTGVLMLMSINLLCGVLGLAAMLMYALVYTPLKRKSSLSVFVGAIPGAMPPLLGWIASTGEFGVLAWVLFGIQFVWQLPHFWAIAWVLDDDYKKAGFKLLPSVTGRTKTSASQVLIYTAGLIPISIMPAFLDFNGLISALIIGLCGALFLNQAIKLYRTCDVKAASRLMFGSFLYLPIVQIILVLDNFLG